MIFQKIKKLVFICTAVSFLTGTNSIWAEKAIAQTYDANGTFYDHLGRANKWFDRHGNKFSSQDFTRKYGKELGIFLYQVYSLDVSYSICPRVLLYEIRPTVCQTYGQWRQRRSRIFQQLRQR